MGFRTRQIHAGITPDPLTGSILTPIYQSTTYVQESVDDYMAKGYSYSRSGNPTVVALEHRIQALEGGAGAPVVEAPEIPAVARVHQQGVRARVGIQSAECDADVAVGADKHLRVVNDVRFFFAETGRKERARPLGELAESLDAGAVGNGFREFPSARIAVAVNHQFGEQDQFGAVVFGLLGVGL